MNILLVYYSPGFIFIFQLKDYRSQYEGYVPMKFSRYYKKMAKYVKLFTIILSLSLLLNRWSSVD